MAPPSFLRAVGERSEYEGSLLKKEKSVDMMEVSCRMMTVVASAAAALKWARAKAQGGKLKYYLTESFSCVLSISFHALSFFGFEE